MQFVAVINSYNRRDLLSSALESLVRTVDPRGDEYAVVVFEAGSKDGSREWLARFAEEHRDLRLEVVEPQAGSDSSFAAGVNAGCSHALERFPEVEFLFLYETDNYVSSAEPLIAAMRLLREEPHLAAVGFTVRRHSGKPCGWGGAFPTVLSFVLGPHLSLYLGAPHCKIAKRRSHSVEWFTADVVYTSPLLIKASRWKGLGGLDARQFPFSDSDLDWAWNVAKAGYQLGVIATDAVVHDNLQVLSNWSDSRVLNFHRARFRLLRKHRGWGVILAIPLLFLRHLAEYVLLTTFVLLGRRPVLALRKRWLLLKGVWVGYESLG